jgi:hypothetical protein
VNRCYSETKRLIEEAYREGFDVNPEVRVHLGQTVDKLSTVTSYNVFGSDTPDYIRDLYAQHNARGGLINSETLSWLAEDGPEMVIPLDGSRRAFELWQQAGQFMNGSLLDSLQGGDGNAALTGGSGEVTIEYSPVLQFYGEAPDRNDLDEALRMSQDEFETMMEKYLKKNARLAF